VSFGRRMVERLFHRAKKDYSDEKLHGALARLARASVDEVMAAVGRGEMRASDVARAMYPDYKEERVARYGAKKKRVLTLGATPGSLELYRVKLARGRFLDAEQHARPIRLLPHQKGVAVDHIGAGVALALQREQFFVIGAQMRGAIENMRNESGLSQRILVECGHRFNPTRSCGEAR